MKKYTAPPPQNDLFEISRESHRRACRRDYMKQYRKRPRYRYINRAYDLTEHFMECVRHGKIPSTVVLSIIGAISWEDFTQRLLKAVGSLDDIQDYGVTWFIAHKKPLRTFDLSNEEQFRECVSLDNLTRGLYTTPKRKRVINIHHSTPMLPGFD